MDPYEEIRRRLEAPPPPREEIVRDLLRQFWIDSGGSDRVDVELEQAAADDRGRRHLRLAADAIDAVVADPPEPSWLVETVHWDANHQLATGTDEEAAAWLRDAAARIRGHVERAERP